LKDKQISKRDTEHSIVSKYQIGIMVAPQNPPPNLEKTPPAKQASLIQKQMREKMNQNEAKTKIGI